MVTSSQGMIRIARKLESFDAGVVERVTVRGPAAAIRAASGFAKWFDQEIVHGGAAIIAGIMDGASILVRHIQSGRMQSYVALCLLGVLAFLGWCLYFANLAAH